MIEGRALVQAQARAGELGAGFLRPLAQLRVERARGGAQQGGGLVAGQVRGTLPLGLVETSAYEQTTLDLAIDDSFSLLTDGIAEAQNEQHELLGFFRVESMLRDGATAKAIAERAHRHGQNDDLTIIQFAREI